MKGLVLFVVLSVLLFAFSSEASTCKNYEVCVENGKVCESHKVVTTEKCKVWGSETLTSTQIVCVDWAKTGPATVGKCVKCNKTKTNTIKTNKAFCKEFHTVKECTKEVVKCVKHKMERKCFEKVHPYTVTGPKTCPSGQQLFFKKNGDKKIVRSCGPSRPVQLNTCAIFLDPHMHLNGRRFEFQHAGDFDMLHSEDGSFQVHARMHRFATTWTGTIGFSILVNGKDVVQFIKRVFTINGKTVNVPINTNYDLPEGGYIHWTGSGTQTIQVFAPNGGRILYQDYNNGQYGNLYVYLPNFLNFDGACTGQNLNKWSTTFAAGLFNFEFVEKEIAKGATPVFTEIDRNNAKVRCSAKGLTGFHLEDCIWDVLRALPGEADKIIEIEADVERQEELGKIDLRDGPLCVAQSEIPLCQKM